MQPIATPIPAHRLQWSPVAPSWIIAGGVIVLAAMPHKLSPHFRAFVRQPLGFMLAAAATAWLLTKHVVLGIACAMLILSVVIHRAVEGFANPPILIKDVIKRPLSNKQQQHWFEESVMEEEPAMIQDRTEESTFLQDIVSPEERATTWYDEQALHQNPLAIQERGVPETDRNPDY
jgi:hypothetical protein